MMNDGCKRLFRTPADHTGMTGNEATDRGTKTATKSVNATKSNI